MYGFVYRTKNLLNGKFYIGKRRLLGNYKDKSYFGSSIALLADIDKYGRENFQRQIVVSQRTREIMSAKLKGNKNAVKTK